MLRGATGGQQGSKAAAAQSERRGPSAAAAARVNPSKGAWSGGESIARPGRLPVEGAATERNGSRRRGGKRGVKCTFRCTYVCSIERR